MMENGNMLLPRAEEDKISNLPDHLIDSILGRLPVQDVIRTNTLSKTWRYTWTRMRELVFDEQFSEKFATNGAFGPNGYIRIINHILLLHRGPISKFHLHIPELSLDSFQEVDQMMLFLSRNDVRELILVNLNQPYELPSHVYSCLQLRKLRLENCPFTPPPLEFEGFLNLEYLTLEDIDFDTSLSGTVFNLPQLKKLTLNTCTNVPNLNIKAKKMEHLLVITCPDAILPRLFDSPCLMVVGLALREPIGNIERVERMDLATMFSYLPNIVFLFLDGHFLKLLIAGQIPQWLPQFVFTLQRLWLLNFQLSDVDQLLGALCLLRSSPLIKRLCVMQEKMEDSDDVRVGQISNHLETVDSLDQTLHVLTTVEITPLEGSKEELLFIKLLLAHSPSLEKLTIQPSETSDTQTRINIAKDVLRFPRISPKAEIICLDPDT